MCRLSGARTFRRLESRIRGNCYETPFGVNGLPPAVIDVPRETIRRDRQASDIGAEMPLSVESALSVRDAAIAIRYHGASYLPVVDDGRLVGIVAVREQRPPPRRDPDPAT